MNNNLVRTIIDLGEYYDKNKEMREIKAKEYGISKVPTTEEYVGFLLKDLSYVEVTPKKIDEKEIELKKLDEKSNEKIDEIKKEVFFSENKDMLSKGKAIFDVVLNKVGNAIQKGAIEQKNIVKSLLEPFTLGVGGFVNEYILKKVEKKTPEDKEWELKGREFLVSEKELSKMINQSFTPDENDEKIRYFTENRFKIENVDENDRKFLAKEITKIIQDDDLKTNKKEKKAINFLSEVNTNKLEVGMALDKVQDYETNFKRIDKALNSLNPFGKTEYELSIKHTEGSLNKTFHLKYKTDDLPEQEITITSKTGREFGEELSNKLNKNVESLLKNVYSDDNQFDRIKDYFEKTKKSRMALTVSDFKFDTKLNSTFELIKTNDEKEKNLTLNISKVSEDGERNLYQLNTDKDNRNKVLAVLTNDKALEIIGKTFDGKKEIEFISKENLEKENNNLIEKISTEYQDIRVKDIDDFDRNVMRKTVAKVGLTLRENEMKNQSSNLFKIIEDEHKDTFKKEIDNLEDKAKFLEKNADKLGLSLNVYGKVKEIYSEDENEYKANVEAVLKTLEEGSLNNFFENLENQKEKMEKYSHSEVPIENVIHKMSYDMKGDIRQDIAKSLDFDSIVRNTATLVMIEENFTVEDAKNIKNMSDEEKSQFVDKINDYISERGSHIKEVKVSDLEKLEKVNFDKVSDLRENSYKEEQRKEKENQKERAYQRDERTDREYDF
jgi:hypothetical protein